jgi:proteic killer suppression protein
LLNSVREAGGWEEWIDFFLEGVESTSLDAVKRADKMMAIIKADEKKIEGSGRKAGNMLEALGGDLKGKYSVLINRQYRIVFAFDNGNAEDVSIMDYH